MFFAKRVNEVPSEINLTILCTERLSMLIFNAKGSVLVTIGGASDMLQLLQWQANQNSSVCAENLSL